MDKADYFVILEKRKSAYQTRSKNIASAFYFNTLEEAEKFATDMGLSKGMNATIAHRIKSSRVSVTFE